MPENESVQTETAEQTAPVEGQTQEVAGAQPDTQAEIPEQYRGKSQADLAKALVEKSK